MRQATPAAAVGVHQSRAVLPLRQRIGFVDPHRDRRAVRGGQAQAMLIVRIAIATLLPD